jgi:GrpB-like predicted nucleotidyltransferase (UPF0157 family)
MSQDETALPSADEVWRRVAAVRERMADGRSEMIGTSAGSPVSLAVPNDAWASVYAALHSRLVAALGPGVRVEHIGSTSIAGIVAKPVIDVLVSVPDIADEAAYVSAIESVGVRMRSRELDIGHVYFRDGHPRTLQVHVCAIGSKWERDHLLFRDYLRAQPEVARYYERVKLAAVASYGTDRLAYTEAKGPFIESVLARAETWAAETGWRP